MNRLAGFVVAMILALPTFAAGDDAPARTLRYSGGNLELKLGGHVAVRFEEGAVALQSGKKAPIRIATDRLTVVFDVTSSRPATELLGDYFSPSSLGPTVWDEGLVLAPLILLASAALAPVQDHDHYFTLSWRDARDTLLEAQFQAPVAAKDDWISAFESATGRPVLDLPAARERLRAELERGKDERVVVEVDRRASGLEPGPYSLVLLERDSGKAEAYLFRGTSVDPGKVLASLRVTVEATTGGPAQPEPIFERSGRAERLAGLRLADRTLRFWGAGGIATAASDATREPGTAVFSFGPGLRFLIRRVERDGTPALTTSALLEPEGRGRATAGRVILTGERLVFEPDDPASGGPPLDLPRSAIASVEVRGPKSDPKIVLESPGGSRSFSLGVDGTGHVALYVDDDTLEPYRAALRGATAVVALALRDFETALEYVSAP